MKEKEYSRDLKLRDRTLYLINEEKPLRGFELFVSLLKEGRPGLCVTRQHPEKLRSMYNLRDVEIFWLTSNVGERMFSPSAIGLLTNSVTRYIAEHKGTVLFLEGMEYLLSYNEFKAVLHYVGYVHDAIMNHGGIGIVSIDAEALTPREFAMFRRELTLLEIKEGRE